MFAVFLCPTRNTLFLTTVKGLSTREVAAIVNSSSSSRPTLQLLPHRLAHLLFHDLSFVSNCLLIVLRVFTLSRFVSSFLTPQANLISQDVAYRRAQSRTRETSWSQATLQAFSDQSAPVVASLSQPSLLLPFVDFPLRPVVAPPRDAGELRPSPPPGSGGPPPKVGWATPRS